MDKMSLMGSNSELTNDGKDDTIGSRGNPYHDPANGRFTSGGSGSRKSKIRENKTVKNGESAMNKADIGSYTASGVRMSRKELRIVSSAILTNHPDLKSGDTIPYEHGSYFYVARAMRLPGDYYFTAKVPLTAKNQAKIAWYREVLKND